MSSMVTHKNILSDIHLNAAGIELTQPFKSASVSRYFGTPKDDVYHISFPSEHIIEKQYHGIDTVYSYTRHYTLPKYVENLILIHTAPKLPLTQQDGSGNEENNTITGNKLNNRLYGLAGKDTLTGEGGDDILDGGTDIDTLIGGTGNDIYYADHSKDTVTERAGEGNDTVYSNVHYTLPAHVENLTLTGNGKVNGYGNRDNNTLTGNNNDNYLYGGEGRDTIIGNGGHDVIDGGHGADIMDGGTGNDIYYVDNRHDTINEKAGEGNDTVYSSTHYAAHSHIENITLTGKDNLHAIGNDQDNILIGNEGVNRLEGGKGNDTLYAGNSGDQLIGGEGDDIYKIDGTVKGFNLDIHKISVHEYGNNGTDTIHLGVPAQKVERIADLPPYILHGNVENLFVSGHSSHIQGNNASNVLRGGKHADYLKGGRGNDNLYGHDGDDILDGEAGKDKMVGGKGNDTFYVDHINDTAHEAAGEGKDTVFAGVSYTLGQHIENLTLLPKHTALNASGNHMDNTINGNRFNNHIHGGQGDDTLYGHEGDDTLNGGLGIDTLVGGKGNDTYILEDTWDSITENPNEGTDTVLSSLDANILKDNLENLTLTGNADAKAHGNDADNILTGNTGNNRLSGGDGHDKLYGKQGDDKLEGEYGNDFLYGNEGRDYLIGGNGNDFLYGGDGDDTIYGDLENVPTPTVFNQENQDDFIEGGKGNDKLNGGLGNDTYLFGRDDGHDTITEYNMETLQADHAFYIGTNKVKFKEGITPQDILWDAATSTISIKGSNDKLTILNQDQAPSKWKGPAVALFEFSSGFTMTAAELTPPGILTPKVESRAINRYSSYQIAKKETADQIIKINSIEGGRLFVEDSPYNPYVQAANTNKLNIPINTGVWFAPDTDAKSASIHYQVVDTYNSTYPDINRKILFNITDNPDRTPGNRFGGKTDDTITASSGDDIVYGLNGNDTLSGFSGDDRLIGGNGDDKLFGHEGSDVLSGGNGNDILDGGTGNDRLYGSDYNAQLPDNDIFIFGKNYGRDTISDIHGENSVHFREGITAADLSVRSFKPESVWLDNAVKTGWEISIKGTADVLTIENQDNSKAASVTSFVFKDGTTLTNAELFETVTRSPLRSAVAPETDQTAPQPLTVLNKNIPASIPGLLENSNAELLSGNPYSDGLTGFSGSQVPSYAITEQAKTDDTAVINII